MTEYYNMNYGGKEVQVESAVRDEEGYSIKGCYAKKNEIKDSTITIETNGGSTVGSFTLNQSSAETITLPNGTYQIQGYEADFVPDNTYPEYPYRATVEVTGVTPSTYAEVVYSDEQATSLNYAPFVDTDDDAIYLYSRTNVGNDIIIPTISIGMDYSDISIDANPTSGSSNAVSSNGVYEAIQQANILLENTQVTFSANSDSFATDYPYVATITNDYITANTFATIGFSDAQIKSGNYAPFCVCDKGVNDIQGTLYIYCKINPTPNVGDVVTIPSIKFGIEGRIVNINTNVTEGSYNPVTSGAVYSALGNRTIDDWDTTPTENSVNPVTSGAVYTALAEKQTGQMCESTFTTGQKVATQWGTITLSFNTPTLDADYYESVSSNTAIKVKKSGTYIINYILGISGVSANGAQFVANISINNSTNQIMRFNCPIGDAEGNLTIIRSLSANDTIQFKMTSNTGNDGSTSSWTRFQIASLSG